MAFAPNMLKNLLTISLKAFLIVLEFPELSPSLNQEKVVLVSLKELIILESYTPTISFRLVKIVHVELKLQQSSYLSKE